jgi:hypothetical protein
MGGECDYFFLCLYSSRLMPYCFFLARSGERTELKESEEGEDFEAIKIRKEKERVEELRNDCLESSNVLTRMRSGGRGKLVDYLMCMYNPKEREKEKLVDMIYNHVISSKTPPLRHQNEPGNLCNHIQIGTLLSTVPS